jgi:DNA-binding XRE family transcriptional regulator
MYYYLYISYMSLTERDARSGSQLFNRIPVLRAERSLSRQDLAKALDISYQTVGYLERGEFNPSLELAFRISEFFGLPIEAIFSRAAFKPMSTEVYAHRRAVAEGEQR